MELSEEPCPLLYSQMLEMYPNLPRDVIQIYTVQYSNNAELCAHMLNLQNGVYSKTLSSSYMPNPSLSEQLTNLQAGDQFDESDIHIENCINQNLQPALLQEEYSELPGININSEVNDVSYEVLSNNQVSPAADDSENKSVNNELGLYYIEILNLDLLPNKYCVGNPDESSPLSMNPNFENVFQKHLLEGSFQSTALHIDVDSDEDNAHSWRPNMLSDTCDIFLPHMGSEDANSNDGLNQHFNTSDQDKNTENATCSMEIQSPPTFLQPFAFEDLDCSSSPIHTNESIGIDLDDHLYRQRVQMNIVKYEVTKTKMELEQLRRDVEKMTLEVKKRKYSLDAREIKRLSEENAKLRVECQCLCMEVDYYLKGKAPLGEVDEKFYKGYGSSSANRQVISKPAENRCEPNWQPNHDVLEERDESDKWACSKCTFENHPEIGSCEMCQASRQTISGNPRFLAPSSSVCYCHPTNNERPPIGC